MVAHAAIVRQDPDKAELKTWVSCEEHILFCCMTLIRVLEEPEWGCPAKTDKTQPEVLSPVNSEHLPVSKTHEPPF